MLEDNRALPGIYCGLPHDANFNREQAHGRASQDRMQRSMLDIAAVAGVAGAFGLGRAG